MRSAGQYYLDRRQHEGLGRSVLEKYFRGGFDQIDDDDKILGRM